MRINVSQGAKPIAVPDVVGQRYEERQGALAGDGFAVSAEGRRLDIQPKDTVIDQEPAGGADARSAAQRSR